MTGRSKKALAAVALVVSVVAIVFTIIHGRAQPEPMYQGQTVKHWAGNFGSPDGRIGGWARDAFCQTTADAVPFLIKAVELHVPAYNSVYRLIWMKTLRHLPPSLRPNAPPVDNAITVVRALAIKSLAQLGTNATKAIPVLFHAASQGNVGTRAEALQALAMIAPEDESVILKLVGSLQDKVPPVREAAIQALAIAGRTDQRVLSALKRVLQDPEPRTRVKAAELFWELTWEQTHDSAPVLTSLREVLRGKDEDLAWAALFHLGKMAANSKERLQLLTQTLQHVSFRLRARSAILLGQSGSAAKQSIPALKAALDDTDWSVREAAAEALRKIEGNSDEARE